jgi:hypothetical protein
MALEATAISTLTQPPADLVESEQLTLLSGHSIAERRGMLGGRLAVEPVGGGSVITQEPAVPVQVLDLIAPDRRAPRTPGAGRGRAPAGSEASGGGNDDQFGKHRSVGIRATSAGRWRYWKIR